MQTVSEILYSENKARRVSTIRRIRGLDQNSALNRVNAEVLSEAIDSMNDVEDVKEVLHFILEKPQCLGS